MEHGAHWQPDEGRSETEPDPARRPFGPLLKRLRLRAGLSQEGLAERAGVSWRTISDLERGVKQRPRGSTVRLLVAALALEPVERAALQASAVPADEAAPPTERPGPPAKAPTNLPLPLTSFVGRESELAAVRRLLGQARLVTLTGAGGCGKTRLALEVARALAVDANLVLAYADGIRLVELAALSDEALVTRAVATVLGVRERGDEALLETLTAFLRPKRLLLLLDTCEHILPACAHLADALLRVCPQLTLLATSREALGIGGEQLWRVPSCTLPAPMARLTLERTRASDAVRLFVQRARVRQPDFALTEHNMALVTLICRRLDGMPLAIELAAARLAALALDQLAARLDDRFRLLIGGSRVALPRQQTLRASLDWSYDLLEEGERLLLRRLAVFAGGWTLEAAESICADRGIMAGEVLDLLAGLVNQSLVLLEERTGPRYRLLETVRQYGWEKLAAAGEAPLLRERHFEWYLTLAGQAALHVGGAEREVWLERLEEELENLRTALDWSSQEDGRWEAGLRLAAALEDFWYIRGYAGEGRRRLEGLLERAGTAVPAAVRARAVEVLALLTYYQRDCGQAIQLFESAHALHTSEGNVTGATWALNYQGLVALRLGEYERATMLLEQVLPAHREQGDPHGEAWALSYLASIRAAKGDYAQAATLHEESLAVFQKLGDKLGIGYGLANLGNIAQDQGDYGSAKRLYRESLGLRRTLMDKLGVSECFEGLAVVAMTEGQPVRAAQLFGTAHGLREAIGTPMASVDHPAYDRELAEIQTVLGEDTFAAAWAAGQAMLLEEAIDLALREDDDAK